MKKIDHASLREIFGIDIVIDAGFKDLPKDAITEVYEALRVYVTLEKPQKKHKKRISIGQNGKFGIYTLSNIEYEMIVGMNGYYNVVTIYTFKRLQRENYSI